MGLEVILYNALTSHYPYLPKIGLNNNVLILISSSL